MAGSTTAVYGVRETLAELRRVDRDAYLQIRKDIRGVLAPATTSASTGLAALVGQLSGMQHAGRTGAKARSATTVRVKIGGRRGRNEIWPLVSLYETGAAGAIADMAGKNPGKTKSGRALIARLGGRPSRVMWPTVARYKDDAAKSITASLAAVETKANRRLVTQSGVGR